MVALSKHDDILSLNARQANRRLRKKRRNVRDVREDIQDKLIVPMVLMSHDNFITLKYIKQALLFTISDILQQANLHGEVVSVSTKLTRPGIVRVRAPDIMC